jgi:hypothetical protein
MRLVPLFELQQTREVWSELLESRFTVSDYFSRAVSPYHCYLFTGEKQTLVSATDDEAAIHAAKRRPWKVMTVERVEMVHPRDIEERKRNQVPALGVNAWKLPDFVWTLTVVRL